MYRETDSDSDDPSHHSADTEDEGMSSRKEARRDCKRSLGTTPINREFKKQRVETGEFVLNCAGSVGDACRRLVSCLYEASERGDVEQVKEHLSHGTCIDVKDGRGRTPLHVLARENKLEIVELLLDLGADVNAADDDGRTALHYAACHANAEMVGTLLRNAASVDARSLLGRTPLQIAIEEQESENAKVLLHHGADANAAGEGGTTLLDLAVSHADSEIVEMLLSNGACVDAKSRWGRTALHVALEKQKLEIAKLLLRHGADVNAADDYGIKPLHLAASHADAETAEMLLDKGAFVNPEDPFKTPLYTAAVRNEPEIVKLLLDFGADVNVAAEEGPFDVLKICGADTVTVFKQQAVTLRAANFPVSSKNLRAIEEDGEMISFQSACEEEVERMKEEKICNGVSFFDVLTKSVNWLSLYMTNESMASAFKSDDHETQFPIYASMLNYNFKLEIERKESLDQGLEFFECLADFKDLPLVCSVKILSFLSNADLKNCCKNAFN